MANNMTPKLKIRKGDTVQVIAGNDRGTRGRVLEVYPERMRILVEGVNIRTLHQKPTQQNQQGGITKLEKPIHYSNVMFVDSEKETTKLSVKVELDKNGRRIVKRIAKNNDKEI